MACSSGRTSSGSSLLQNSGSEEEQRILMDQRKKKRMLSNRESARRSRMRKQQHLDDLMAQVAQLRKENNQILTSLNITTQYYLNVEEENSVMRAQMTELSSRLQCFDEIIQYMKGRANGFDLDGSFNNIDSFIKPWNAPYLNQPITASSNIFPY